MKTTASTAALAIALLSPCGSLLTGEETILAGVASRDITPKEPIWLSGYAARNHASVRVENRLSVKALALKGQGEERLAIVSLDNCEVTREFTAPALKEIQERFGIAPASVIIVSSHTHSGPVLVDTLPGMFALEGVEGERVRKYSTFLRKTLVEVVGAALDDLEPANFAVGASRAGFAMNRRVYRNNAVQFGENPDGPADRSVPVLRVSAPDGSIQAILFGYACHGTTVGGSAGDDFYAVCGDYMAYARDHIEAAFPGAQALFLTGFAADINPSPRGKLAFAQQHGLELAGAVSGVLNRPMRPVSGRLRLVSRRIQLPLEDPPTREAIEADARSENRYLRNRAKLYLEGLDSGKPRPHFVDYPLTVVRVGDDLTFVFLAGEVVVDYALRLKRELRFERPWLVGFAAEVPCYIPSKRILNEGGYEADHSLIYYGIYGPFQPAVEDLIVKNVLEMVAEAKR